jgi:5-methylcytosine-specific restriction endonuclease McrA/GTPase SAR1 family protein
MNKQLADVLREQINSIRHALEEPDIKAAEAKIPGCRGEILRLRAVLKELECKLDLTPEIQIVFLGPSRHGKSTLLNALARQSLLPTSDVKPCTASILRLKWAPDWFCKLSFVRRSELLSDRATAVEEIEDYLKRAKAHYSEEELPDDPKYVLNTLQRFIHLFGIDPSSDPQTLVEKVRTAQIPSNVLEKLGRPHEAKAGSFEKLKEGLSPYLSTAGVYWTVVESCEISGPFDNWHPNLSLVDLPGTNDSNPQRTAITNSLRDKAQAVAIVTSDSNIGPDILSWLKSSSVLSDFLESSANNRQRLFIIRTKLDSFNPEIDDVETEQEEEALRQEGFVKYKNEQEAAYREMLREIVYPRLLASSDIDNLKKAELLKRVDEIPVHFISAQAYEAFEDRIKVGPTAKRRFKEHFGENSSATGIPGLRDFVNRMAAEYLAVNFYEDIQLRLEREVGLLAQYFQREETTLQAQRSGAGKSVGALVLRVEKEIVPWIADTVQNQVQEFSHQAQSGGEGIRHRMDQAWRMSDLRLKDKQEKWELLHWNTLRATGRKGGEHMTAGGQYVDINEDICSVLLGDVILAWTSYRDYLIQKAIDELTDRFSSELQLKFQQLAEQVVDTRAREAIANVLSQLETITLSQRDELLRVIDKNIRKLESIRTPAKNYIKACLSPTFERISREAGVGCQSRMRNILVQGFQQNLTEIRKHISKLVLEATHQLLSSCSTALLQFSDNASLQITNSLHAVEETTKVEDEKILSERENAISAAKEALEKNRYRSQEDYWAWHDTLYPGGSSNSPEWFELSRSAKERDGWKCLVCGNHEELHADHITPLSKGGPNDLGNLQTLCVSCHEKKTGRPLRRWQTTR